MSTKLSDMARSQNQRRTIGVNLFWALAFVGVNIVAFRWGVGIVLMPLLIGYGIKTLKAQKK